MQLLSRVSAILVLSASTLIAHADSIYTYTGQDFTFATAPFTTGDFVSGSFTTTTPLGDNLNDAFIIPASFSFNDGVDTLNNTNGSVADFFISTNASGAIVDWTIDVTALGELIEITGGPKSAGDDGDIGTAAEGVGVNNVSGAFTSSAPTSVTPEPSTFALLGTGILGVAGMMRRKFLMQP
jgi:PEP-CTERM motif